MRNQYDILYMFLTPSRGRHLRIILKYQIICSCTKIANKNNTQTILSPLETNRPKLRAMQASMYIQALCIILAKNCFLATNNHTFGYQQAELDMSEQFQKVQATYLLVHSLVTSRHSSITSRCSFWLQTPVWLAIATQIHSQTQT